MKRQLALWKIKILAKPDQHNFIETLHLQGTNIAIETIRSVSGRYFNGNEFVGIKG